MRGYALADKGSYVSPVVIDQAGQRVLVAWSGQRLAGLIPRAARPSGSIPTPPNKMPINVPGPAFNADGTGMFLSVFDDGSRLVELGKDAPTAAELWHRQGINERTTDALHCMISPPYWNGGHVYGIDSYGQLRCLVAATGERVWENLEAIPQRSLGHGLHGPAGQPHLIATGAGRDRHCPAHPRRLHQDRPGQADRADHAPEERPEGTVLWSYPAFAGTRVYVAQRPRAGLSSLA